MPEVALDLYKRSMHAAELALGPDMAERYAGQFWAAPETRPYMRALRGLADVLLELEREDEAMAQLETMLRLNPADDQGVRYALLAYYLDQHELQPARTLLAAFETDTSTAWLYARVLLAYREERHGTEATRSLVEAALTANRHVPGILAQEEPDDFADGDEAVPPGSAAEATEYALAYEAAWTSTPGALGWLLAQAVQFP
jgi:tetratricopeptide (TPR) repeat protein